MCNSTHCKEEEGVSGIKNWWSTTHMIAPSSLLLVLRAVTPCSKVNLCLSNLCGIRACFSSFASCACCIAYAHVFLSLELLCTTSGWWSKSLYSFQKTFQRKYFLKILIYIFWGYASHLVPIEYIHLYIFRMVDIIFLQHSQRCNIMQRKFFLE